MASFLHKLGRVCFRKNWIVLLVWLVVLAGVGMAAVVLQKPLTDSISIPGTRAQSTITELGQLFPNSGQGSGRIVFHATDGQPLVRYGAAIDAAVQSIGALPGVATAVSPTINPMALSQDGQTGYAQVQLQSSQIDDQLAAQIKQKTDDLRNNRLDVELSSGLIHQSADDILGPGEIIGVGLALLVLVITFGALVAAGLPIVNAILAVGVSMAALFTLTHYIDLSSTSPILAVMLGLAVGIDYSLFIISRYRSLLLQGYGREQAAARAIGTAGNAVVFAALTVIIALSALSVVRVPFMTAMGLAAAGTIAIAALVALTVTPALLRIVGIRAFGKKTAARIAKAQAAGVVAERTMQQSRVWGRWVAGVTAHPLLVLIPLVLILLTVSLPTFRIDLGLPGDQTAASDTTQRKAYDLLTTAFGPGYNAPLTVLVKNVPVASEAEKTAAARQIAAAYAQYQGGEQAVASPAGQAQIARAVQLVELQKIATVMARQDNVQSAMPALLSDDKTAGIIQVIPKTAPNDPATAKLIKHLRDDDAVVTGSATVSAEVTGATALEQDVNQKLLSALPQYLLVVVGLSLILLLVAFRSILVPITATLGFLLSVGVMFGSVVAIFQWGWFGFVEGSPLVSFVPIIIIGILFGLAMDYQFFLVSGMHEVYSHTKDAKEAISHGFLQGAKVVAAAATIMVLIFAGFITNHSEIIRAVGLGLAIGIFVDAFIVRMTLIPAIMALLGKSAWWLPKWLARRLPHVSIEGEERPSS